MEDVLRKEWGFKGFIVSDWMDIEHCVDQHFTAANNKEAFLQSILAGMDMHMHGPEWQQAVVELVKEGKITEERINKSVRRILYTKFQLGLFEHPYVTVKERDHVINSPEHKATALEATRNSIVLLKNEGSLLPREKEIVIKTENNYMDYRILNAMMQEDIKRCSLLVSMPTTRISWATGVRCSQRTKCLLY